MLSNAASDLDSVDVEFGDNALYAPFFQTPCPTNSGNRGITTCWHVFDDGNDKVFLQNGSGCYRQGADYTAGAAARP